MRRRAYNDPEYRAARAALTRGGAECWHCGRPATQLDHQPALALHEHVRGSGCCVLVPVCSAYNARGGQRIALASRRRRALVRALGDAEQTGRDPSRQW